jgi:uncharacterized radical SAM superfamily protein
VGIKCEGGEKEGRKEQGYIMQSGMKERHIVVTNAYLADIKDFEEKSKYLKIFHKMYLNDIKLSLRLE